MSEITLAELRDHVETDLVDSALQRILDAEEEEIVSRFGNRSSHVEAKSGGGACLFPARPISAVTSITEWDGTTETTLDASDYRLHPDGKTLSRLCASTSVNPSTEWASEVILRYVPGDGSRWLRALIDLVRLALQYSAKSSESVGDYSSSNLDYTQEREKIVAQLIGRRLA